MQNDTLLMWFSVLLFAVSLIITDWLGLPWPISATIAVTLLTAMWWVTEVVPIGVASQLPIVLLPILGVIDHKTAASVFGHPVILLLLGAFMMAKGLENSQVDKRLALAIVSSVGRRSPRKLLFALMLTTAMLSMWMSNVVTVLMMLPIALGITATMTDKTLAPTFLLAIAYAASIGGMGTPVGTPANVVFTSVYQSHFNVEFNFLDWMKFAIPIIVIGLPIVALWLGRHLPREMAYELPAVGTWRRAEKRVLIIFSLVIFAWVFKSAPFGGWSALIPDLYIDDGTIAILGALLMFIVPSGETGQASKTSITSEKQAKNEPRPKLLNWPLAMSLPWNVIFLLAAGICLAKSFQLSGLSELIGSGFSIVEQMPLWLTVGFICLFVTFLTEITSNTATTALLMPILASVAMTSGIDPKLLMLPAAMSASCAFMLPAATAPNAVVYGANAFNIRFMIREGFVLNLLMSGLVSAGVYFGA